MDPQLYLYLYILKRETRYFFFNIFPIQEIFAAKYCFPQFYSCLLHQSITPSVILQTDFGIKCVCRWHQCVVVRSDDDQGNLRGFSHPDASPQYDDEYFKFKQYNLENFVLRNDHLGDQCCFLNGALIEVSFFARSKEDANDIFIVGRKYLSVRPLFDDPLVSLDVGVFRCNRLTEELQFFRITDEKKIKKVYRTPLFGKNDTFVCSILLHSMEEH